MNAEKMEFCTKSVLNWLQEDEETLNEYLKDSYERGIIPNYTDLLKRVSGTTKENVRLDSIYVYRRECTRYILNKYNEKYKN